MKDARAEGNQRALRIAAPALVAVLALAAWQAAVVGYDIPPYLVPSPMAVLRTLVADRALLAGSLQVTLGIALTALALSIVLGVAIALVFVQSRWIEMSFFPYAVLLQVTPIVAIAPLIIIWVKDTRVALVRLRGRRCDLPDHLQHDARLAQRRPRSAQSLPDVPRHPLADAVAPPRARRAPVLLRRAAHFERACADRRRGGGVRRGNRRIRARDLPTRSCSRASSSTCRASSPRLVLITASGVVLFALTVWASRVALARWHESEVGPAR